MPDLDGSGGRLEIWIWIARSTALPLGVRVK
jgi:hypothetical protein